MDFRGRQMKQLSTGSLLWAALKSLPHKRMNKNMIGWKQHMTAPAVDLAQAQAFAKATNDKNEAYFGKNPMVPPFFLARLVYPLLASAMLNPRLKMNLVNMVHGDMHMNWYRPIRPGDQLDLGLEIKSISDTRAGEIVHLEVNASMVGQPVASAMAGLLVRAKKKKQAPQHRKKESTDRQKEVFRLEVKTYDGQQLEYAKASGDHNFIHTNYLLARLAGLPRTIMHGMCVMAMSCAALVDHLASGDPARLKEMGGRFASPAIPGQTLSLVGYETNDDGTTSFEVLTPSGKPAIKNGLVKIK